MLPKTHKNYKWLDEIIQWPKNSKLIAHTGSVFLVKYEKNTFAVVYGLQVVESLDRISAAIEFGNCVFHQAEREGLLN